MALKPRISIIIATYNSAATLERALMSVISQDLYAKELLVADGASTDETPGIIKQYADHIHWWCSEKDTGVYDAWNKALEHANGEWIYFLGSDDYLWDSTVLTQATHALDVLSQRTLVAYGQIAFSTNNGGVIAMVGEPWQKGAHRALDEMVIPHQGTFHRRELFTETGLFNTEFEICGDFELILRQVVAGNFPVFIPDLIVASMTIGGMSSIPEKAPVVFRELRLARTLHGLPAYSASLLLRQLRSAFRRFLDKVFGKKVMNPLVDTYRQLIGKPKLWTRND